MFDGETFDLVQHIDTVLQAIRGTSSSRASTPS